MKFKDVINEGFNLRSVDFHQIDIERELKSFKFERINTQANLTSLIKIVKGIKSKKIYAFFGIGTFSFVWNHVMFIYEKGDGYTLEVYKSEEEKNKKVYVRKFNKGEFEKFMGIFSKRWEFKEDDFYIN